MSNENLSEGLESQFHEDYYGWPKRECPLSKNRHCPDGTIFHNCMDCDRLNNRLTLVDWAIVISLCALVFGLFSLALYLLV